VDFGFVVHPLMAGQRTLLGLRSRDAALAFTGTSRRPAPRVVSRLRVRDPLGGECRGLLVAVPHLPEELLADQERGVTAVLDAVRLCHAEGASVVGLGAVAAVIGGQGKAVAEAAPCPVTTGNTFTALAAVETLDRFRRRGGRRGPVGLAGPPGSVATAILRLLVARGEHVRIALAAPPAPLRKLAVRLTAEGPGRAEFVGDALQVLRDRHVLVAASSTGGRLPLSARPAGSVVIDVAAPVDVLDDVPPRDDVLLLDGEYVRLPSPLGGDPWRTLYGLVTGQRRHVFACYAEPMVLALARRADAATVGRDLPLERVRALGALAAEHGFWVDELFERGRPLGDSRLALFG
jgi:predicted amino acid dehydrogenase